jgi:endonuclease/exonuclease/phosphatase family metal-dependent hydrolase
MSKRLSICCLLAAAIALLGSFACGGGGSSSGGPKTQLVVMDQNVLHGLIDEDPAAEPNDRIGERIKLVADALKATQPDIVTLQEIVTPPGEGYPDDRQIVLDALGPDYHALFGNFLAEPIDQKGVGQMTFTRLPILSSENKKVSQIRSAVRVTVQTDSGPLSIYNVHLEGTGAVLETGQPAELEEIQNVIDFVEATRNGGPAIVAGDFNSEPDDPAIQAFVDAGFIDALATAGEATCEKAGDPGCTNSNIPLGDNPDKLSDHRIDYIFARPGDNVEVSVSDASLWDNEPVDIGGGHTLWPSDHIGMRATIELQ